MDKLKVKILPYYEKEFISFLDERKLTYSKYPSPILFTFSVSSTREDLFDVALSPIKLCSLKDKVYFEVKTEGSGISAQAQAIAHGLSRALSEKEESFKKILKAAWLLTRDARKVERKKPGKKKARKSPSWSKR